MQKKTKVLTSASQSQNKIAKILYSQLWSGAERTENYLVSRCTRENYRSLWWQWGKKLPHGPRDAYIFHSVEKTARLVLHQRYNSSWGEGTRATRCIAENATAWSLGIIYNFERRGQRENIKMEGLFNNAAGLYLTNPCSVHFSKYSLLW